MLKLVATTLISTVGGAAGPLFGTAFLRASTAVGGADSLDGAAVAALLAAARDGIVARGKAESGDKTMVDAWTPAVDAAAAAAADGCGCRRGARGGGRRRGGRAPRPPSRSSPARDARATSASDRPATGIPGAQSTALLLRGCGGGGVERDERVR